MEWLKKAYRKLVKKASTITIEKVHYCFCLMLVLGAVMFVTVDNATVTVNASGSDGTTSAEDKLSDYSFYTLASATAAAFSSAMADTDDGPEETMKSCYKSLNTATGGGILAYCDADTKGLLGMFMNAISLSSATKSYSSLDGSSFNGEWTTNKCNPFAYYVCLGATLADLGIDSTGSAAETIGAFSGRMMTGSLVEIVFLLSQSVVLVFGVVVKCLKVINPFTFFQSCTIPGASNFEGILQGIAERNGSTGITSTIQENIGIFVSSFYEYLFTAGWTMLSISFVIMFIQVCFPMAFGKGPRGSFGIIKTWLTKALFLFGGIAILGVTYTDTLNWLEDETSSGNGAAERVVASTFCDFEGWAYAGMPLDDVDIDTIWYGGTVTANSGNNVQLLCYQINQNCNSSLPVSSFENTYVTSGADKVKDTITQVQNNSMNHGGENSDEDAFSWVISVLDKYKSGAKITSSAYESAWKNAYWNVDTMTRAEALGRYFECYGTAAKIKVDEGTVNGFRYSAGGITFYDTNIPNPFGARGITNSTGLSMDTAISATPIDAEFTGWKDLRSKTKYKYTIHYSDLKLSAMSIYNYLNTSFGSSEMIVYSSAKSSSNYIRDSHYAVSLVGKGTNSAIILIMCITLLFCYTILGFAYGLGIIFTNVKRGFRLLIAIPGAMLGSLQAIAKVVSYTVLMIIEIVINVFLYCLTTEMLYTIAIDFTSLIGKFSEDTLGEITVAIVQPLISIFIIIALWWFTIKCIQLRKPIIKSVEEMADNVISKFIVGADRGGSPRASANGQSGANAASGVGTAAGAAAGKAKSPASVGDAILHPGKASKARREAKKAKGEAKANMLLGQMGLAGGTSSAVQEEQALDAYQKAEKENKEQARKEKTQGAVKAVVGTAEVAAGAATGNAALAARGASNIAQGGLDMQNAETNAINNSAALANQTSQAIGGRGSVKAAQAPSNNVGIAKFDAVNEAKGVVTTVVGGPEGLVGAGGSGSGVASTVSNVKSLAGAYKATGGDTTALVNSVSSGDYAGAVKMVAGNQGVKTLLSGGSIDVDTSSMSSSTSMSHSKTNTVQTVDSEVTQIAGNTTVNRMTGNGSDRTSFASSSSIKNASTHGVTSTQTETDTLNIQHQTVTTHQSIGLRNGGGSANGSQPSASRGNNYTQTVDDSYTINHNANVNENFTTAGSYGGGNSGYRPPTGSSRYYDVTDTINIDRSQHLNYQKGKTTISGNANGDGYVQMSGTSTSHNVTDNVNVIRSQHYKEINNVDAPKNPNRNNK